MNLTSTRIKQLIKEELEKINEEEEEEEHDLISQTLDRFLERTQTIDEEKKEQFKQEIFGYLVDIVIEIKGF
tara:strand:+ start:120 stop:335 length:216 start_codon:yes stop_codon:yes gene_type:complete